MGNYCNKNPQAVNLNKQPDEPPEYIGHIFDDTLATYRLPFTQYEKLELTKALPGNYIYIKDNKEVAWNTFDDKSNGVTTLLASGTQNPVLSGTLFRFCNSTHSRYFINGKIVREIDRAVYPQSTKDKRLISSTTRTTVEKRVVDRLIVDNAVLEFKVYDDNTLIQSSIADQEGNGTYTLIRTHNHSRNNDVCYAKYYYVADIIKFVPNKIASIYLDGIDIGVAEVNMPYLHGLWTLTYPNGKIKETRLYVEGKLHGSLTRYDLSGKIVETGYHVNDRPHGVFEQGRFKNYHYEGKLQNSDFYKLLVWALTLQLKLLGFEPQVIQITLLYILSDQPKFLRELGVIK
jgi:antitoxin component YwqK of YwqJK toxin-antitoxin module